MIFLGIDCSAVSASVAIVEFTDGEVPAEKILSSSYTNVGLTHSQTLVPMIKATLENAALKGITEFDGEKCFSVSTLESMAYNFRGVADGIVCSVMDARCEQVYTACFEVDGTDVTRLTEDTAVSIKELGENLKTLRKNIIFVGDGASLCYNILSKELESSLAPSHLVYQNAVSVAILAKHSMDRGEKPVSGEHILPVYLRAPQAQRNLKKGN